MWLGLDEGVGRRGGWCDGMEKLSFNIFFLVFVAYLKYLNFFYFS